MNLTKMRILYISPKMPYPLSDGGRLRSFNHIKFLSKKHKIISLSFIQSEKELNGIEELEKYCDVKTVLLPKHKSLINSFLGIFSKNPLRVCYEKSRKFSKKAKQLSKKSDLVIIQAPRMAEYAFDKEKTIIDVVDVPSLQIRRAIKQESFIWKIIWLFELPRMSRYEKKIRKKFQKIIVASKDDLSVLGKGIVLKNGTDINNKVLKFEKENNIMFLGNMNYKPNIDAVSFFVEKIFPLIKKEVSDAKFYVVGKNESKVKKYQNEDVIITGFVEDLGSYFSKCKVFTAPMRLGSGIQNKVLEALNYEVPVVTTPIVNKGVEAENKKEILIADNADQIAKEIIILLKDKKMRDKISSAGKKFLKKNYSWSIINKKLSKIIKDFKESSS